MKLTVHGVTKLGLNLVKSVLSARNMMRYTRNIMHHIQRTNRKIPVRQMEKAVTRSVISLITVTKQMIKMRRNTTANQIKSQNPNQNRSLIRTYQRHL
jgi:hypothetical protein